MSCTRQTCAAPSFLPQNLQLCQGPPLVVRAWQGQGGPGVLTSECSPRLLEHSSPLLVNYQRGRVEGSRTPCPAENPNESGRAMQLCLQTAGNAKGSLRVGRSVVPCGPVGRPGGHSGWRIPSLSSANYTSKKGVKNATLPPAKKKKREENLHSDKMSHRVTGKHPKVVIILSL